MSEKLSAWRFVLLCLVVIVCVFGVQLAEILRALAMLWATLEGK